MPGVEIPEVAPIRFDADDVKGFKAHLTEHGCAFAQPARCHCVCPVCPGHVADPACADACVKEAANAEELEHARELFWQHLEVRCTSSDHLHAAIS